MNSSPAFHIQLGKHVGRFRVVHILPKRVRLKSVALLDPKFDKVYFQALLEALNGVEKVRINTYATSLTISFDGKKSTWQLIENYLSCIPEDAYAPRSSSDQATTAAEVAFKGASLLLAQVLHQPFKAAISWAMALKTIGAGMESLLFRGLKIETLDALAVGLSLWQRNYFTANAIVTLLALGDFLENSCELKSTELLKSLLRPPAEDIWVLRNGKEIKIPLNDVKVGESAIFGAGELIVIDGKVASGEASLNQSSISGESIPVHVSQGDPVSSGSVVEDGRLIVSVERTGSETSMARISRFIDQSLRNKSDKQSKSSAMADKLVPVTLGLSGLVYALTRDFRRAASVLTVDFSCAIKLSTPIAVRSGMYAAGQAGVLLKGVSALEMLEEVDTLVFDKTGTLTSGRLSITDVVSQGSLTENQLLALAAGAEEHYDHPIARAVVREAQDRGLALPAISRVDFIVAHGVSAIIDGNKVLVGSHHFIAEDEGIPCDELEDKAHLLRLEGKSLLYIASMGKLLGLIALRDEPRTEASEVLDCLKAQGIKKIVVLTGDHLETAKALVKHLPQIDEIYHELRPEEKADIVEKLKGEGRTIAYIGDGVNDAPALISAHVGIAMPKGADLAKESAQVVLLAEDLRTLSWAREVSKRTSRIIKKCFTSTIAFNSITMLLATAGLSPVASALLHNLSTVGILTYASTAASKPLKTTPKSITHTGAKKC